MEKYKREIEMLQKGHDADARAVLCRELEYIIQNSDEGQIGIAGFIEDVSAILETAKVFATHLKD